jgi:hypothetical protein
MSRKSRETILKRVREQKRREKAVLKRERRLARKQAKNNPEGDSEFEEGEYEEGEEPIAPADESETIDDPIEEVAASRSVTPEQP